jgi:hypothetical protein
MQTRTARLSAEALSLPSTHFAILGTLGSLLLLAFVLTGAATGISSAASGSPPIEGSLLFGLLCGTYVLSFNFALDLNRPFDGVYQVRRSAAATNLLSSRILLDPYVPNGGLAFERLQSQSVEPPGAVPTTEASTEGAPGGGEAGGGGGRARGGSAGANGS